ncbi:DUF5908 family protein [Saccharicrinis sp. FJH54]|uniref:DUF5908 family protein n=1 Tax=Saccharicrinis sp. FJH54 TaxID=3344665 RepID=UPI0035D4AF49
MPIEIKELHIRINVDDSPGKSDQKPVTQKDIDRIIAACIEQVMDILAKNKER